MTFRQLEHTADLGIEVCADSLNLLFAECLQAQTDCVTRLERVEAQEIRRWSLRAADLPQLLVDFLSEAIYLFETEEIILANAEVEVGEENGGWALSARVLGERFDLDRHRLKTLLKAVTYHRLSVGRVGRDWVATVIFDI
jgi:SHS2 domain-containing protein